MSYLKFSSNKVFEFQKIANLNYASALEYTCASGSYNGQQQYRKLGNGQTMCHVYLHAIPCPRDKL
jgi:hypothetical protein